MQNSDESINQIIWSKCPKNIYVEQKILEIGVYSEIVQFNDGAGALLKLLNHFNISDGICFQNGSVHKDRISI